MNCTAVIVPLVGRPREAAPHGLGQGHELGNQARRGRSRLGRRDAGDAAMQAGTAAGAGGMCGRGGAVAERAAHLIHAAPIEPALLHTLLGGPAVGAHLAGTDVVMAALVMEDEEAHGRGGPFEQVGVEHDQTRRRHADDRQARVQLVADIFPVPTCLRSSVRHCSAGLLMAMFAQGSPGPQADRARPCGHKRATNALRTPPQFPVSPMHLVPVQERVIQLRQLLKD